MVLSWGDHFDKRTVSSLTYFLNYSLLSYSAQSQILIISLYVTWIANLTKLFLSVWCTSKMDNPETHRKPPEIQWGETNSLVFPALLARLEIPVSNASLTDYAYAFLSNWIKWVPIQLLLTTATPSHSYGYVKDHTTFAFGWTDSKKWVRDIDALSM